MEPTSDPDQPSAVAVVGDVGSLPAPAEVARTLVGDGGHAILATLAADGPPDASLVAYMTAAGGGLLLCLGDATAPARNARVDHRVSMLVAAPEAPTDGAGGARASVSLSGALTPTAPSDTARGQFAALHPRAGLHRPAGELTWWLLEVARARCSAADGRPAPVDVEVAAYAAARPDPVAARAVRIIEHMNRDHADACLLYARHLAGVADALHATLVAVDHRGMTLHVDTPDHPYTARVAFDHPVPDAAAVRSAAVRLLDEARRRGGPA